MANQEELQHIDTCFETLLEAGAISSVWRKLPPVLAGIEPCVTEAALTLLCVYFSFIDDGNTCIPLAADELCNRWNAKWTSLFAASSAAAETAPAANPVSKELLAAGIRDLEKAPCLLHTDGSPFVCAAAPDGTKWLFARKYYAAKCSIEARIHCLFTAKEKQPLAPDVLKSCKEHISCIARARGGSPFMLNDEQAEAIVRGQQESLIITGGPGTGKTTVVCFLLWELLSQPQYANSPVYLAAPSGKASDRMKESINGGLSGLTSEERALYPERFAKLNSLSPRTIHRLLSFNPSEGHFAYNRENQFPRNSVFVIDEASMIDIELFAALLQAIPDSARLFLLGDKNQLPSVEAGAVLADLIAQRGASLVELTESKRFTASSEAGNLSRALQAQEPLPALPFKDAATFTCGTPAPRGTNPVFYYTAHSKDDILFMLTKWSKAYYSQLLSLATALPVTSAPGTREKLAALWNAANTARILCAERQGIRGIETINSAIIKELTGKAATAHFAGELLMVTQNQKMYNLYNGDCGVVVSFTGEDDDGSAMLYLMLQKEAGTGEMPDEQEAQAWRQGEIFHIGSFMFYPLHYIAEEALESAYAITIHKSQGSGYDNILIMLPENTAHPLLNRQLVYTAVTRTQGNTSIVASQAAMEAAHQTVIRRESLLTL